MFADPHNPPARLPPHLAQICALAQGLQDGVIILGPAQDILWANDAALGLHGIDSTALLGASMADYLARFQINFHRPRTDQAGAAVRAALMNISPANASPLTVSMTNLPLRDNDGRPIAFVLVLRPEPLARKDAAAGVPDGDLARFFAAAPTPAVIINPRTATVILANTAFAALTGLPEHDLPGMPVDRLFPCDSRDQRRRLDAALEAGQTAVPLAVQVRCARGDTLDVQGAALCLAESAVPCVLFSLRDVTAQRRDEAQLFAALQAVMQDTTWFSRTVIEKLAAVRAPSGAGRSSPAVSDLTPREREVLGLISHGLSDAEIAKHLCLTRSTVRNHVATLYSKIDVHSRGGAIVWARERGINLMHLVPAPQHTGTALAAARFQLMPRMKQGERALAGGDIRA